MPREGSTRTILGEDLVGELAPIEIFHPPGTFAPTPASRVSLAAIAARPDLLSGRGVDWGCGTGCLAIAAARVAAVRRVLGLEILPANVEAARGNARINGVAARTGFLLADGFEPREADGRRELEALRGRVEFLLTNPPSSDGDDGFSFRRRVLAEARAFLAPGARVFLAVSLQYGEERVARLVTDVPGYEHGGVLASTGWVPFDLARPDLLRCLEDYVAEEARGGPCYSFRASGPEVRTIDAHGALAAFRLTGASPLSRWQTRLLTWRG